MRQLPEHLQSALERELDESEEVLWIGQQAPDIIGREAMIQGWVCVGALTALSALIGVPSIIALLEVSDAVEAGAAAPSLKSGPLTGIGAAIVLIVIGLVFGRGVFVTLMRIARETVYAVTPIARSSFV